MRLFIAILIFTALAAAGAVALRTGQAPPPDRSADPVRELVSAAPFTLERPATHWWRAEQPRYDAGWIVVLSVDPRFVEPHQVAEPVLYAGAETVERVNHGHEAGRVVGVIPSPRGADGMPSLDLASVVFFFGPDDLPETITADAAAAQFERVRRAGGTPFSASEVAAALQRGGGPLRLAEREELDERAALLVLEHSPAEQDLGLGLLAPRVR